MEHTQSVSIQQRSGAARIRKLKHNIACYLFLLPSVLGIAIFSVYPIVFSLMISFSDFNGVIMTKIGFFNYQTIFGPSLTQGFKAVMQSFSATFLYAVISIPLTMVVSFMLALLVEKNIRGMRVIRVLCYLPVLIPGIASGMIWMDFYNPYNGLANQWLSSLGLPTSMFFEDKASAMPTLIVMALWGIGGGMILWLAALGNVSPELKEAARLDGANYGRILFRITIPMCTPIIFYMLINNIIGCLQVFDTYAYAGTGPDNSLYFISIRIYLEAFVNGRMGYASAIAWLLFIIIAILTLVMFKTSRWVFYQDEEN